MGTKNPAKALLQVVKSLTNFTRNMWNARKKTLHGDTHMDMKKRRNRLQQAVQDAYNKKHEVDDTNGSEFDTKINVKIQQNE